MPNLISFIVPTLSNDSDFKQCIASIVNCMTWLPVEYEIICVVPSARLRDFNLSADIFRVVSETKSGIYSAMNDGISASDGDYLYFIGADDRVLPGFAEILRKLITEKPDALWFDVLWSNKYVFHNRPRKLLIVRKNSCHQGVIYSRAIFRYYGHYIRQMKVQADHYLNIRIIWEKKIFWNTLYLKIVGASYAGNGYSSRKNDKLFWKLYPLIVKKYANNIIFLMIILKRMIKASLK